MADKARITVAIRVNEEKPEKLCTVEVEEMDIDDFRKAMISYALAFSRFSI